MTTWLPVTGDHLRSMSSSDRTVTKLHGLSHSRKALVWSWWCAVVVVRSGGGGGASTLVGCWVDVLVGCWVDVLMCWLAHGTRDYSTIIICWYSCTCMATDTTDVRNLPTAQSNGYIL
jgi:hypothetical protein